MENLFELISIRLKGLRAENDMSLEDVGNKLGLHRETIRRYECNPSNMNVEILVKMLNLYNVKLNYFFNSIYGNLPYDACNKDKEEK